MRAGTTPPAALLRAHLQALESGLLERSAGVRLLLLAALAGEHVLLIGPPGTAKSELARRLHRSFDGTRYFERLLTRFSTPEELFGPLSLKALEDDRYERLIDGYLPTAGIAFLDEVFKANSAILNALLTLLNEREFDNGAGRQATPLVCLVGATNEAPADDALAAFHDRFLLRVPVAPVGDASFEALLAPAGADPAGPAPLTAAQCTALRQASAQVTLDADAVAALTALRQALPALGLAVSDRRWRQFAALLRTAAASEGRATVDALDLWLAPFVAGADADGVARVAAWVETEGAALLPPALPWLETAVEAFETQLHIERQAPAEEGDDRAGKLAVARSAGGRDTEGGPLRIVSDRMTQALARRWSPVHVAARLAQVDEVAAQAAAASQDLGARHDRLARQLADRLWLPPALGQRWLAAHVAVLSRLRQWQVRLAACRAGFAALPQDDHLPASAPTPVALGERM